MKNKKVKKSIKTVPSWFLVIGISIGICMTVGFIIFLYAFPGGDNLMTAGDIKSVIANIIAILIGGILPIILIIICIRRGLYSLVTIDQKGIRRALFGIFCKVSISWEELCEMKCFYIMIPQMFCSKESLRDLSRDEVIKKRGIIQVPPSAKVLAVIRQYTDKEIIGIPEEVVQNGIQKYK